MSDNETPENKSGRPWAEEGLPRWAVREAYELGLPNGAHDVLVVALFLSTVIAIYSTMGPQMWVIARAGYASVIALHGALLMGYLTHYAGQGARALRRKVGA